MRLSKGATYLCFPGASFPGVFAKGRLLLWWPGKVTATSRRHLCPVRGKDTANDACTAVPISPVQGECNAPQLKPALLLSLQLAAMQSHASPVKNLPCPPAAPPGAAGPLWLLGVICLFLFCCVASAQTADSYSAMSAGEKNGQQASQQHEWELTQVNGLLLFKREKVVGEPSDAQSGGQSDDVKIVEESWFMPAVSSHFSSDVAGITARSTVVQTFRNPTQEWLHGTYQFPLPEDAAVDVLKMRIGKREIIGEIQRKQEARKRFAQAKRSGQKATLVEQQTPNLFTTNLANIGPGEEIEVEIQFQQKARFVEGEFRLRFPTTFIPRAMLEGMSEQAGGAHTTNYKGIEQGADESPVTSVFNSQFSAQISLNAGAELAYVDSPHYSLETQTSSAFVYSLTTPEPVFGDRDLEIIWRYADASPQVLHYREATADGEYGLLMLMPGDALQAPQAAREVTFVMDTSSSMAGESIRQAKAALRLAVQSLSPDDRFNLIEFNSDATGLWHSPEPANTRNKDWALYFLNNLEASGGTDIFSALQLSMELQTPSDSYSRGEDPARVKQLVFVTDGAIGYEPQLLAELEQQLQNTRLFTVAIGPAPNSYFMQEAARVGRGSFTHISKVEQVNSRMSALLQRLASPSLTNIEVDFGMEVQMYPQRLPDLYHGEPLVLSYLAPQAVSDIQVTASRAGVPWRKSLTLSYEQDQPGIAKHWAQHKIRHLSRLKRLIPATHVLKNDSIVQQITDVALQHQLVSAYTSLIAVEQQVSTEPNFRQSAAASRVQKDILMASMPNTAAGSRQAFILALLALLLAVVLSVVSWLIGQKGEVYVSQ